MLNDRFESGLKTRKEVLGSDYVENSIRNATDFDRPFQEFITSSAWDGVWNRGPLDRKTKSLITLSVLVALRAEDEIALHLRGAINNGLTPDEIMAMLIHASVYAGVPSSLTGVRIAKKVFSELGVI
ncbi:4-carboxymuconolactone decarboxylase [SAR202 cluster bacterium AC-647-P02_OGT_505m]|nr:4-carboxymuconolactone decarboxylase [SAR202 cluster bacterium AC-647-P02_OGT_505m]